MYFDGTGYSTYFDGDGAGFSGRTIGAFAFLPDGDILLTFTNATSVPGISTVDDSDIVRYDVSTGFSLYFDGSDVGLSNSSEEIDALVVRSDGSLGISTTGTLSVPGASAGDEDIILFTPVTLGANTSGSWSMLFDASDVALSASNEDVDGASLGSDGNLYLTTTGSFSAGGVSGSGSDVLRCLAPVFGSSTSCASLALYFDGDAQGLSGRLGSPGGPLSR